VFDPDRRHLIAYIAAAAVLVVIVARHLGREGGPDPVPSISMAAPASAKPAGARPRVARAPVPLIWIDVAGAVQRPGLYSLPKGARVAAALQRAGGATRHANRAAVNLAAKLADGQQVFVPRAGESSAGGGSAGAAMSSAGSDAPAMRISLSNASQAELEQLDGIGPSLAQRIIQYREQHGGFGSIDELQQVAGIGPKRFAALRGSIEP
jgi:competence protein ComEA